MKLYINYKSGRQVVLDVENATVRKDSNDNVGELTFTWGDKKRKHTFLYAGLANIESIWYDVE